MKLKVSVSGLAVVTSCAPGARGGWGARRKRVVGRRAARVERDAECEGGSEVAHVRQLRAVVAEPEPRRALESTIGIGANPDRRMRSLQRQW